MASREEVATVFKAAAKALRVSGNELGDLLALLTLLTVDELLFFPTDEDHAAIVQYVRSLRSSKGAEARMAKERPKAGASTSAPTAEHLHGQHGENATDALVARVAEATAKATVKGLKPLLKPVLQHVYGPRSSSSAQSKYRPAALQHYTGEPQPAEATCAVSGVKLPVQDLVAGHIYQRRWPPTSHVNIDDPSNIMLMHREVEQLFDNFMLTVTPVELEVVVLHKQRMDRVLFTYTDNEGQLQVVTLGSLHCRKLALERGTAPSEYALRVHATWAFTHALQQQWCSEADIPPMVGCDRELFQGFLQDSASVTAIGSSSGGSSGADSGSSQDANITGEAGATDQDANMTGEAGATDAGGLSSSGGHRGSAGVSDEVVRDLAVSAQQQLKL